MTERTISTDDTLSLYFDEIRQIPLLTADQEQRLGKIKDLGIQALNNLLPHNTLILSLDAPMGNEGDTQFLTDLVAD